MRTTNEYNANWPVLSEAINQGPVTVLSINHSQSNDRFICNLRAMIPSVKDGELIEANLSWPSSFGQHLKFKAGDRVTVDVEGGYIKRISQLAVVPLQKRVSAVKVNAQVGEAKELETAGKAVTEALKDAPVVKEQKADMPF